METSRIASLTLQSDDQIGLRSYIRLRPLGDTLIHPRAMMIFAHRILISLAACMLPQNYPGSSCAGIALSVISSQSHQCNFPRLETVPQSTAPITAMSAATLFIVLIRPARFSAARIQPLWPISPS